VGERYTFLDTVYPKWSRCRNNNSSSSSMVLVINRFSYVSLGLVFCVFWFSLFCQY